MHTYFLVWFYQNLLVLFSNYILFSLHALSKTSLHTTEANLASLDRKSRHKHGLRTSVKSREKY